MPISDEHIDYKEAVDSLTSSGQEVAAHLLSKRVPLKGMVNVKSCVIQGARHVRLAFFPLLPNTSGLTGAFSVAPYKLGGLMLTQGAELADQPALSHAVGELKRWAAASGISSAARLCEIAEHESKQALLVHAAESRLEGKLADLAAAIAAKHAQHALRVVCIAGPTASGKTTFSHKLALALRAQGIAATPLTVDHYYLPLDQQPKYQVGWWGWVVVGW